MLADVIDLLACPVCAARLALGDGMVRCGAGHSFDVAKQGYVNLLPGGADPGTADSPEMVAARVAFLGAGHYDPLMARLADRAAALVGAPGAAERAAAAAADAGFAAAASATGGPAILDAGAGAGHYLAAVLDRLPDARGLALDLSKYALRPAAKAHPRIGAAVADVWRPLPVADASIDVILNVFAPRNAPEFARVLAPGGALLVVTPGAGHLAPLISELGLVTVDDRKAGRLAATLGDHFTQTAGETMEFTATLTHDELAALIGMGPSARHLNAAELQRRLARIPEPVPVTCSFELSTFTVT